MKLKRKGKLKVRKLHLMIRLPVLSLIVLVISVLFVGCKNSLETKYYPIPEDLGNGTIYYVSSSEGDDNNDGKSPDKAMKTLYAVNKLALNPGDSILLKRNDIFQGTGMEPVGSGNNSEGQWITIDAYGKGSRPVLKCDNANTAGVSLSSPSTKGGYRIRNIVVDGFPEGIISIKESYESAFNGLIVDNCDIKNTTTGKPYGEVKDLPEGLDIGYGIFFRYAQNTEFTNINISCTDVPVHFEGERSTFSNIECYDSRITGVLFYGTDLRNSTYEKVMESKGNIIFKDSKILYTGSEGYLHGTTGLMLENLRDSLVENIEIAYTSNGYNDLDGNAITLENLNINCTIKDVYGHDNDGPFLLAMEHSNTKGYSKDNKIVNCVSVNNGKRDYSDPSFFSQSFYQKSNQKILIKNCVDMARNGKAVYKYDNETYTSIGTAHASCDNFIAGVLDVCEEFDISGLNSFDNTEGATISNSHLVLSSGSKINTKFSGSNYSMSVWIKGKADLCFMEDTPGQGYVWSMTDGTITANKCDGVDSEILEVIKCDSLKTSLWNLIRIECLDGTIKTYLNSDLVSSIRNSSFSSGRIAIKANETVFVDELTVYRNISGKRDISNYDIANIAIGGKITFSSLTGKLNDAEGTWNPSSGIGDYSYRAKESAFLEIVGENAYIQKKHMNVDIRGGYNILSILMINGTTANKLYIDYSTDNGASWHTKTIEIHAMSNDSVLPFRSLLPGMHLYTVDMSDISDWSGTINGLRIRTDAVEGYMRIRQVTISK